MSEAVSHYTLADRLLHRLALGLPALAELSFDLDQKASAGQRDRAAVAAGQHVFVTGLARAGTTILLRSIHESGLFRSLTYRDMPFPLAPNLWQRVSRRWQAEAVSRERAHGDRIAASVESPEALEQVFWRIHAGHDYIGRDALRPHDPDARLLARFQDYVGAVLASGEAGPTRYLSKNNNNILRLPALLGAFPAARFVIPFRRPETQAASLLRQHRHFSAVQRKEPFVRRYMDWLVHHEFGEGHRPFDFGHMSAARWSAADPNHWLALWIDVHETLCALDAPGLTFVCHEDLCQQPAVWDRLVDALALAGPEGPSPRPDFVLAQGRVDQPFDAELLLRADALYSALRERGRVAG
ncbi:sulfotransferase [Novosphingobium sp. 1949]|uniref:Sulfotransferase n=1 Tax=Novosphingobium organovorum TaxID=2930092 RepID=A0ABT0BAL2_9SPHN|nr:sulfotransferase [Novosphingobium organovorum]MCJ2182112.1 sulfotransferase [Novosphingobium organovorum]